MLLLWGKDSEYPQHHISEEAWLMQLDAESITWKQVCSYISYVRLHPNKECVGIYYKRVGAFWRQHYKFLITK